MTSRTCGKCTPYWIDVDAPPGKAGLDMSIQFGKWSFSGKAICPGDFERVRPLLAPYGPDGEGLFCKDSIGILYRALYTTKESRDEVQPYVSKSGFVICWDGRLDNRDDLVGQLGDAVSIGCTDLSIAAAAFDQWGANSFAKLIGDWALSVWNPRDQILLLAKDFVGTRPLYYAVDGETVFWCTTLDPLVQLAGRPLRLQGEYIAGWMTLFPAPQLTPFVGIQSVPPGSFVRLSKTAQTITKFWDLGSRRPIRYRSDHEYEAHFRSVFAESVRRRLRSDAPVLAELSGGMDSSSIVCMADDLIAQGLADTPRLDTVSYYDDSEPNWDERPYFTRVEQKRSRTGTHINIASDQSLSFDVEIARFPALPGSGGRPTQVARQFADCLESGQSRVVLSGIGGDEVTGGVPTPIVELQDLLARAQLGQLARHLKAWALEKRTPWLHLLLESVGGLTPFAQARRPRHRKPAAWLQSSFVTLYRSALQGYESPLKLFGPLPSSQQNAAVLEALRRQLGCSPLPCAPAYEKRYPYLDRDLLEFLFAIPREQLLRPGQRRSLMRRALAGIVPPEVLNRRRKAYAGRTTVRALLNDPLKLREFSQNMLAESFGIVDSEAFLKALQRARNGHAIPTVTVMRTLSVELWLRRLRDRGVLENGTVGLPARTNPLPNTCRYDSAATDFS